MAPHLFLLGIDMFNTLLLACIIVLQLITIGFLYILSKNKVKETLPDHAMVRGGKSYGKTYMAKQEFQKIVSSPLDHTISYY